MPLSPQSGPQPGPPLSAAWLEPRDMPWDLAQGARIAAMAAFGDALYLALVPAAGGAATLWRHDPATQAWRPLPEAGTATGTTTGTATESATGAPVTGRRRPIRPAVPSGPAAAGDAAMVVFQGAGDAAPCLYVALQGPDGAQLLRSADGRDCAPVLTVPANPVATDPVALAVWDDRLVMVWGVPLPAPAAAAGTTLPPGCILVSRDPARAGTWEVLSAPGMGDPDNLGITALAVHQGRLCAGTANPVAGFQIWARGPDDAGWTCLIDRGATRHGMNPAVGLLASHHGHLWIGSAMDQPPIAALDWPAAELLRIEPDGIWDLVAGEARFTPEGLRLPLSLLGPGFEDPGVTRFAAMTETASGQLILGGGPLAGLWISAGEEDWEPLLQDADDDAGADGGPDAGGVTAMAQAAGRVWIAMGGRLFALGSGA